MSSIANDKLTEIVSFVHKMKSKISLFSNEEEIGNLIQSKIKFQIIEIKYLNIYLYTHNKIE